MKIKISCIFILMFVNVLVLFANDAKEADSASNWKTKGYTALNFNQLALMNWAKGGESSFSGTAMLDYSLNYLDDIKAWDNSIHFAYGILTSEQYDLRKTQDKLDINSKFGFKAVEDFYYTALFHLKTQFAPGYKYPNDSLVISRFFAPAYLVTSIGIDYKYDETFSLYLSPMSGKFIIVADQAIADSGAFTSKPAVFDSAGVLIQHGRSVKADFGAYLTAKFNYELMENVHLRSEIDLFNNYMDRDKENRINIDVDWETTIVMKVNEYIAANIFIHLIYDHDTQSPLYEDIDGVKTKVGTGPRLQLKETLGIGFSYKF